ncbi:lipid-A-disaccharide synthase [Aquisalinus flavus]|uniref:lipid-A-disaccharide synthase n=1 Tax=Aquisalinus flavus TaxID=1526572 RepID=UPI00165EDFDA|nr:lipid-A-disaccharide synthase [Aquisalinus flavus]MBD0427803.1 lipid-A-disaccharide synthase [Aquisalinus flavus]
MKTWNHDEGQVITPDRPLTIMLAAVEPSGDSLGAALYAELKQRAPDGTRFFGCGGEQMSKAGFESAFPIDAFSVVGFTDVIGAIPEGMKRARDLAELAARERADIAIFIDGWTFSRIGAKRMKHYAPDTLVVKYAAPQVWASRPQRVDFVKQYFDAVLTLLPFEPAYFEREGVAAEFVGNPNFERAARQAGDPKGWRQANGLVDDPLLLVLPGSRRGEVTRLADPFCDAIRLLHAQMPDLKFVMTPVPSVEPLTRDLFAPVEDLVLYASPEDRFSVFRAADAAMAASGTVSTELAIARTPMVVAYRVDELTYYWAQRVMISDYVSILNIAAQREIIPELLQNDCTGAMLAEEVTRVLTHDESRQLQLTAFDDFLPKLGLSDKPAAARAAEAVLRLAARKS